MIPFLVVFKSDILFRFCFCSLKLIFALFCSNLLLKNSKLSGFYRAAYYLPSVIGGSVGCSVMERMFAMDG